MASKRKREEKEDTEAEKPVCQYGATCYRTNPAHMKAYSHPDVSASQTDQEVTDTGRVLADDYDIKEKLGSGTFATVKKVVRKTDKGEFAVKMVRKDNLDKDQLKLIMEEVKIMKKLDHQHCVRLYDVYETSSKLSMIIELLTGGELFDRIVAKGSYSEKEASSLTKTVIETIAYLHKEGIAHRDLKPENLLYATTADDAPIKVTDFGLANLASDPSQEMQMTTACGSPGYCAPEILKNEPYNEMVDLWSIGVILYILLCGFPPFYNDNQTALLRQIKQGKYNFPDPYWKNISEQAKDLVRGLLTVDPKRRLTCEEALAHPWIAGSAAPATAFDKSHLVRLQLLQARAKFRRGVQSIIAVNKFARGLEWQQRKLEELYDDDSKDSTTAAAAGGGGDGGDGGALLRSSSTKPTLTTTTTAPISQLSVSSSSSKVLKKQKTSSTNKLTKSNSSDKQQSSSPSPTEKEEKQTDKTEKKKTNNKKAKTSNTHDDDDEPSSSNGKKTNKTTTTTTSSVPEESPVGRRTRSRVPAPPIPSESSKPSSKTKATASSRSKKKGDSATKKDSSSMEDIGDL